MAGNRNSGMGSPLCSGVCAFYLPPRSYNVIICDNSKVEGSSVDGIAYGCR